MSVRYFYFGRPKSGAHKGIITIAAEDDGTQEPKKAPTFVNFAMALCAPADHFCKAQARAQAAGRLRSARAANTATRTKQVKDPWTDEVKEVVVPRTDVHRPHRVTIVDANETPAAAICRYFNDHIVKASLPKWCKNWRLLPKDMAVGETPLEYVGSSDPDTTTTAPRPTELQAPCGGSVPA